VVTRSHVSIGDVLNQLRDEFPDITISKIRFLESQGLVEPERTPSGYRKFYAADVERLRFVLRQQREHFLPLKVIKDRLDEADRDGTLLAAVDAAALGDATAYANETNATDADNPAPTASRRRGKRPSKEPAVRGDAQAREQAEAREVTAVVAEEAGPDDLAAPASGVSLTRAELAKAAALSDEELGLLEEYGLVAPSHTTRDRVLFDEDALAVARIASGFMRHGIEPRHLRMYRAFAEREASLFEQVLLPYRRQRNPDAQARTAEALGELAGLGRRLRTVMLRQAVRRSLGG
jgi:DNA-binding transcriptional MerR regulator